MQVLARTALDRIVVISDPHLLSPQLVSPGQAIEHADAGEVKMMALSDDIMMAVFDSIIAINPRAVLVTGDLTHNGERLSHQRMAWHLSRLAAHGIKPLVIPGNHDCNNPYACRFDCDSTSPVSTITRDEFAVIYCDYGYGDGSQRDPASLSYCCEPVKGLVVIGIDSNMDELNTLTSRGDSVNAYHNAGRVKPETLQWVVEQAQRARSQGKMVIAMMHHHLIPHFDRQDQLLPNYIIKNHDEVANQFMQAGIHAIFTGHLHVTDAATFHDKGRTDSIVDIATGSSIVYPFALRIATLDGKHKTLSIDTHGISATQSCPNLRTQGRERIVNATPGVAATITGRAWPTVEGRIGQLKRLLERGGGQVNLPTTQQHATQLLLKHLKETISSVVLAVVEGNENEHDSAAIIQQVQQGLHAIITEVAPDQADDLWTFFMEEVYPKLDPMVRTTLEDLNAVGTPNQSRTDDLTLSVKL